MENKKVASRRLSQGDNKEGEPKERQEQKKKIRRRREEEAKEISGRKR